MKELKIKIIALYKSKDSAFTLRELCNLLNENDLDLITKTVISLIHDSIITISTYLKDDHLLYEMKEKPKRIFKIKFNTRESNSNY